MSQRGNGKPSVTVTESVSLLSAAVAAHIAEVSRASIESKGSFAVCFSGARASWNDVQCSVREQSGAAWRRRVRGTPVSVAQEARFRRSPASS